jgi:hypothetical protein
MADQNPIRTRAWLTRTLNDAAEKMQGIDGLGVTVDGPISWVDPDGVEIRATRHGDAVTIEVVNTTEPIKRWDVYVGWLADS